MPGSFRCHLTGGLITSFPSLWLYAVTDMSFLFAHHCLSAINTDISNNCVTLIYIWHYGRTCLLQRLPHHEQFNWGLRMSVHSGSETGYTCSHPPRHQEPEVLKHREGT